MSLPCCFGFSSIIQRRELKCKNRPLLGKLLRTDSRKKGGRNKEFAYVLANCEGSRIGCRHFAEDGLLLYVGEALFEVIGEGAILSKYNTRPRLHRDVKNNDKVPCSTDSICFLSFSEQHFKAICLTRNTVNLRTIDVGGADFSAQQAFGVVRGK